MSERLVICASAVKVFDGDGSLLSRFYLRLLLGNYPLLPRTIIICINESMVLSRILAKCVVRSSSISVTFI